MQFIASTSKTLMSIIFQRFTSKKNSGQEDLTIAYIIKRNNIIYINYV
jgi:hypothetical protein